MSPRRKGLLVVISAPSGCGKTTVVSKLLDRQPRMERSISATTRKPRDGETHGRDYFFLTQKEFLEKRKQGAFLEWAKVFDNYYGTFRDYVSDRLGDGRDVVLAIDVQGARQVRKKAKGVFIFLMPPSMEDLKKRLINRKSDTKKEIEKRLDRAHAEMGCAKDYDYIVTNRVLEDSVRAVEDILKRHRTGKTKTARRRRAANAGL